MFQANISPAINIEGIFRLNGSARHVRELQDIFDSAPKYGEGFEFDGYTCFDVASLLRRYLVQLPDPIIPYSLYNKFRDPLKSCGGQVVSKTGPYSHAEIIHTYQTLIGELDNCNQTLLLYLLELFAVFSSKSDTNLMTPSNLSIIFQPCVLSHPQHEMALDEYRLNQNVLVFLIENQIHFCLGLPDSKFATEHSPLNTSSNTENTTKDNFFSLQAETMAQRQETAEFNSAMTPTFSMPQNDIVLSKRSREETITATKTRNASTRYTGSISGTNFTSPTHITGFTRLSSGHCSTGPDPNAIDTGLVLQCIGGAFDKEHNSKVPIIRSVGTGPKTGSGSTAVVANSAIVRSTGSDPIEINESNVASHAIESLEPILAKKSTISPKAPAHYEELNLIANSTSSVETESKTKANTRSRMLKASETHTRASLADKELALIFNDSTDYFSDQQYSPQERADDGFMDSMQIPVSSQSSGEMQTSGFIDAPDYYQDCDADASELVQLSIVTVSFSLVALFIKGLCFCFFH